MTRFTRSANGKYVVHNKSFDILIGTRAQVWHGTAYKTSGNLTKSDLLQNKNGRIVSKAKHSSAKKDNRLVKAGYGTKKGKFGFVKLNGKTKSKRGGNYGNMGNSSNMMKMGDTNMMKMGGANMMKMGGTNMMKMGGRSRKNRRGGSGMSALSPSSYAYSGNGSGTSGVDLQFMAGNAG